MLNTGNMAGANPMMAMMMMNMMMQNNVNTVKVNNKLFDTNFKVFLQFSF